MGGGGQAVAEDAQFGGGHGQAPFYAGGEAGLAGGSDQADDHSGREGVSGADSVQRRGRVSVPCPPPVGRSAFPGRAGRSVGCDHRSGGGQPPHLGRRFGRFPVDPEQVAGVFAGGDHHLRPPAQLQNGGGGLVRGPQAAAVVDVHHHFRPGPLRPPGRFQRRPAGRAGDAQGDAGEMDRSGLFHHLPGDVFGGEGRGRRPRPVVEHRHRAHAFAQLQEIHPHPPLRIPHHMRDVHSLPGQEAGRPAPQRIVRQTGDPGRRQPASGGRRRGVAFGATQPHPVMSGVFQPFPGGRPQAEHRLPQGGQVVSHTSRLPPENGSSDFQGGVGASSGWAVRRGGEPDPAAGGALRNLKTARSLLRWGCAALRRRRAGGLYEGGPAEREIFSNIPLADRSEIWDNPDNSCSVDKGGGKCVRVAS